MVIDFTPEQIRMCHNDEREGYADLGAGDRKSYDYVYHKMNTFYGFLRTGTRTFGKVPGLGSAYGDESLPIIDRILTLRFAKHG